MWEKRRISLFFTLYVTVSLVPCIAEVQLIIKPDGMKHTLPQHNAFFFTCKGNGGDLNLFKEMKWSGPNNEEITKEKFPEISVSEYQAGVLKLTFENPKAADSGKYTCSAAFDNAERLESKVEVLFYEDITFENCASVQSLTINEGGTINCKVNANPQPYVIWKKDDEELNLDRYMRNDEGIAIQNVKEEDGGVYSVEASVEVTGKLKIQQITVDILIPPNITQISGNTHVVEGVDHILECVAEGFPDPEYEWINPKKEELSKLIENNFSVDTASGTLTISNIQADANGTYTCVAKNSAGRDSKNVSVFIIVKPEIRHFEMESKKVGDKALFQCVASGSPLPHMTIRKESSSEPITSNDHFQLNEKEEFDTKILEMEIPLVERSDDGLYYCSAENEGANVEKVAHFTVQFPPDLSRTPTSVKTWGDNVANLSCIAEAIPNATISWKYDGDVISNSDRYTIHNGASRSNLVVRPIEGQSVYGTYTCSAVNEIENKDVLIKVDEAFAPGKLSQVVFDKITSTTITFKFYGPEEDGGMPIRGYVVEYNELNQQTDEANQHTWEKDTSYILEELKPRTTYNFRFAAKNDVGIGEWKVEPPQQMRSEAAPDAPTFITKTDSLSEQSDKFKVQWTIPMDNGRSIEYFELRYFQVSKEGEDWKQIGKDMKIKIDDWTSTGNHILKNLRPSTFYRVEVRAHNSIGNSELHSVIFQTASASVVGEQQTDVKEASSFPLAAIIAIVVALILVVLIIVDVTCYLRYHCGLLYVLRNSMCGKSAGDKVKEVSAEEGKGSKEPEHTEEKNKTEVDNPAFDKEKEPLKQAEEKENDRDHLHPEETPMIANAGSKDGRPADLHLEENKNKSPKGSKTSIGKSSPV